MSKLKIRSDISKVLEWIVVQKTENVFLVLAATFGLMFVFLTPPIAVVDEENHYFRALELSQGNLFTDELGRPGVYGANIPENTAYYVYDNKGIALELNDKDEADIKALGGAVPNKDKLREVVYNGSAAYSPAGYIPQSIGMLIANSFNLSNDSYLYIGRILNIFLFIGLTYYAIRIIPIAKNALLVVALLPMTLYQAASLSMDATVMASTFLLFALVLAVAHKKSFPNKKTLALILLMTILVALTKYVYLLICFPVLGYWIFISKNKTKPIVFSFCALLAAVILLASWNTQLPPEVTSSATVLESSTKQVSVSKQIMYILGHPFEFVKSIVNLIFFDSAGADVGVRGMIGRFGWRGADYFVPLVSMMIAFVGIMLAIIIDKFRRLREARFKVQSPGTLSGVLIVSAAVTFVGVITALYVTFTSVGSNEILGVQGRYFIPILPALAAGLVLMKPFIIEKINVRNACMSLYGIILINLMYTAVKIAELYYIN